MSGKLCLHQEWVRDPTARRRLLQRIVTVAIVVAASLFTTGCNIVGPIMVATAPEPTVPAQYELEDRPTLVFVDDRDGVLAPASLADVIADRASEQLITNTLVTSAIRPRDAVAVARAHDRANNLMAIGEIGEAVGAEQVIYVQIVSLNETPSQEKFTPVATATVKVLDVVAKKRLFPEEGVGAADAYAVNASIPPVDESMYRTASTRRRVRETMALALGDEIAKVFYEHLAPDRLGDRLDPR